MLKEFQDDELRVAFLHPLWMDLWELRCGRRRVKLYPWQGRVMLAFLDRRLITQETMVQIMYPRAEDMPEGWSNVMKVQMWRLRHEKLRPFGWDIKRYRAESGDLMSGAYELRRL